MIKTVIFDLGNVLVYFSYERMILQLAETLDLTFGAVERLLIQEFPLYERGELTTDQFLNQLQLASALKPARELLLLAMNNIFEENRAILPLVTSLKKQDKKLLLLSNTNEAHFHYLQRHFPILHLFDIPILSYEMKSSKPDPIIFQHALQLADCAPHECFYLDDMQTHVMAARKLGIDAEVYKDVESLRKDLAKRMLFL